MSRKSQVLNEADLLNAAKTAALNKLREKLEKGETLKTSELDRLAKWTKQVEKKPGADLVRSKVALADGIPINRVTLDKYWNAPGHPKKSSDGRYSISAWRQFIETVSDIELKSPGAGTFGESEVSEDAKEDRDLKRRKLLADAERAEVERDRAKHDLELSRGLWIKKEEVAADIRRCNEAVKQELLRRFKQTAPAEYEACGGDLVECRMINEAHLMAAFQFMHNGTWENPS